MCGRNARLEALELGFGKPRMRLCPTGTAVEDDEDYDVFCLDTVSDVKAQADHLMADRSLVVCSASREEGQAVVLNIEYCVAPLLSSQTSMTTFTGAGNCEAQVMTAELSSMDREVIRQTASRNE